MSQRINLQYSIKLEDLDDELSRLLISSYKKLKDNTSRLSAFHESGNSLMSVESLEMIDSIRISLSDIDHGLSDIQNITRGYLNYISQPSEEPELYSDASQTELQSKIDAFKNSMRKHEIENTTAPQATENQEPQSDS